jgi:cell fate (sporulation/competence/biofilm development) regulator YlbF (YheA/YmcA/DUF963 family)
LGGNLKFEGLRIDFHVILWCNQTISVKRETLTKSIGTNFMDTITEETTVLQKTKDLCQAILEQPSMVLARERIDAFMADEKSRTQYEDLMNKGEALQQKQKSSTPLEGNEIAEFEKNREALLNNAVARGFLDAQEELHSISETVSQYVSKTLELGRVPTEEDLGGGSCGSGCGCHH